MNRVVISVFLTCVRLTKDHSLFPFSSGEVPSFRGHFSMFEGFPEWFLANRKLLQGGNGHTNPGIQLGIRGDCGNVFP